MHVTFVVAGLGAGGAERVIALISSAWVRAGRIVTVVSFDATDTPVYHDFDPRVRMVRLGRQRQRGTGGVAGWLRRVADLRAHLARQQPDVVISFLTKVNVVALLATIGSTVPVIVCERNNPRRQVASRQWQTILRRLYPRAAAIVLQTEASRECLPATVASRAIVIPNPVAIPPVRSPRARRPAATIVAAGRLEDQKGFDRLLVAFAAAAPGHPEWRLRIWGTGPCGSGLAALAASLGIADRVRLSGVSDVPLGWLADADIFVLSSRFEGFPNALAEAMAAGLPVIAFDCDYGPRELIDHGTTGLLVPDGDIAALAAAMRRAMASEALRASLGHAARRQAATYAVDTIVGHWDDVLASITSATAIGGTMRSIRSELRPSRLAEH